VSNVSNHVSNKIKSTTDIKIFKVVSYIVIIFFSLYCFLPFLMVVSSSFTDEQQIINHGYSFLPLKPSLSAYTTAFKYPMEILSAYGVTIFVTAVGTSLAVFLMSMTAYVVSLRSNRWGNAYSFFMYITTLFSGGLVPWYILMVKYLHMQDKIYALIIPNLFGVFYILILKGFMRGIPDSLAESAKIDGANDFTIFLKIIFPMAKPAVATITLMVALGYWNDWYLCMLFIQDTHLQNLQHFLYTLISSQEAIKNLVLANSNVNISVSIPAESMKMAMTVIATGPILLLYPLIQKYFVKGLTLGAVKG